MPFVDLMSSWGSWWPR